MFHDHVICFREEFFLQKFRIIFFLWVNSKITIKIYLAVYFDLFFLSDETIFLNCCPAEVSNFRVNISLPRLELLFVYRWVALLLRSWTSETTNLIENTDLPRRINQKEDFWFYILSGVIIFYESKERGTLFLEILNREKEIFAQISRRKKEKRIFFQIFICIELPSSS